MTISLETQHSRSCSAESSFDGEAGHSRDRPQEGCLPPSIYGAEHKPHVSFKESLNLGESESSKLFEKVWALSTEDNNLALHGFRRFKTTHLLNLRLLEEEIDRIDHQIYQAGLNLGLDPSPADRLELKHCQKEEHALRPEEVLDEKLILKLRDLLRQYDDGIAAFNRIMAMETCSLIDDQPRFTRRTDLSLHEIYNTRLVRVDLAPRTLQDPLQRCLNKCLRWFRFRRLSKNPDNERGVSPTYCDRTTHKWSYQNTVAVADIVWRILVALAANIFIVVPLAILSYQSSKGTQLITVSVWVVVFSFLTSIFFRASNQATVAVISAYAAVLSVFISNGSTS
ncbi:uncharacterized protein PAC_02746 [Phialocephala subalpina]|uniref:DUF6594 domain-containing protein n=1 Tax=Phialocephala subalpina TaxID=576137 RepID=A0A1L7WJA7_9HELO|nr:uncharacterized protein PAC_02746 [Phialocephala subalpina]